MTDTLMYFLKEWMSSYLLETVWYAKIERKKLLIAIDYTKKVSCRCTSNRSTNRRHTTLIIVFCVSIKCGRLFSIYLFIHFCFVSVSASSSSSQLLYLVRHFPLAVSPFSRSVVGHKSSTSWNEITGRERERDRLYDINVAWNIDRKWCTYWWTHDVPSLSFAAFYAIQCAACIGIALFAWTVHTLIIFNHRQSTSCATYNSFTMWNVCAAKNN